MTRTRAAIAGAVLALAATQEPLRLEIVFPPEGSYVSDRLTLEARIMPPERRRDVSDVTFYADGRQVCQSLDVQAPKCHWDAGPLIKAHQIRVVASTQAGERLVATMRTKEVDFKASANVEVVQVNATVADRDGRFVRGLTPNQFRLSEDGRPQTISHFAAEEAPLEIVVAMDISASMTNALGDLKVAVRQFLSRLRPVDQVTLIAFNDELFVLTQRETNAALREEAVDRLSAYGGTMLYDAIVRSLELLSRQPGRRSLVVFSDGEDQSSQATFSIVDQALKATDATLFMVGLGRGRQQADLRETLEALAEPTGGRALFADRPEQLGAAFTTLLDELTHQYLLGYESTNVQRDGQWRRLALEVPGTRYRVRARQGYLAPR